MVTWVWQLGFTQLCHKVSKNDFKVSEQLTHFLNSGEVLTRICFRAELDFILIGKQHSDLSAAFLNSGGGQVFLQHHIFHISLVHVRTTKKGEKLNEVYMYLIMWNILVYYLHYLLLYFPLLFTPDPGQECTLEVKYSKCGESIPPGAFRPAPGLTFYFHFLFVSCTPIVKSKNHILFTLFTFSFLKEYQH